MNKNHYVYKLTHVMTGHFYIGIRSCECEPEKDHYMGSGSLLKRIDKKMLIKEILTVTADKQTAYAIEALIVNDHFVERQDTLNMKGGGECGKYGSEAILRAQAGHERKKLLEPDAYKGRKPSYNSKQIKDVLEMLENGIGVIKISKIIGLSKYAVSRIKSDPEEAYRKAKRWGL